MKKGYIKGQFSEFEIQKNMNSINNFNNVPFVKSNHLDGFFLKNFVVYREFYYFFKFWHFFDKFGNF